MSQNPGSSSPEPASLEASQCRTSDVAEIPLTKGHVALVDAADYEWLSQWKWFAHQSGPRTYATRNARLHEKASGSPTIIYMHRVLCPMGAGQIVDHADRNSLNNTRANLRPASYLQNGANSGHRVGATGYRGVIFERRRGAYRAEISPNRKAIYLGQFADPVSAARAYDKAAQQHFGEFAILNFPEAT